MAYVMTAAELAAKATDVAKNYKTLYVMGCFGAPLNEVNKARYKKNSPYNRRPLRQMMISKAKEDVFGFDCVNLIKGLLWGWAGDKTKQYGGARYASNGVPDTNADGMIARCSGVSTDFSHIAVGEAVWMPQHIGIYIGNGLVVECSPKWANRVQITACGNIGKVKGYNTRTWRRHGKLPWCDYSVKEAAAGALKPAHPKAGEVAVYRLYNPHGFHHYTANTKEREALVKLGWRDEGVAWYSPTDGTSVWRLYNRAIGDHCYTTNVRERVSLQGLGLVSEGAAWASDPEKHVPIYRLYNTHTGEHFYTANKQEYNALIDAGWTGEGAGFYALRGGEH